MSVSYGDFSAPSILVTEGYTFTGPSVHSAGRGKVRGGFRMPAVKKGLGQDLSQHHLLAW